VGKGGMGCITTTERATACFKKRMPWRDYVPKRSLP
jgi:hypothetical protein